MRRGYTRETYLDLVAHVKEVIPNVQLSGDLVTLNYFLATKTSFALVDKS
jgi:tRNA A37 methylthiotransferase MiaB